MGLRVLQDARPDDGRGRLRHAGGLRRDLSRRHRRARRAGRRLGGAHPRRQAALRSVREPAADAPAAGAELAAREPRRGRHRHGVRARRTPRASTPASAGGFTAARRTRWRSRSASSRATASSGSCATASSSRPRPRKMLASATKSNALTHSMVLWDEVAEIVRKDYPAVEYRKYHVDALAARMITHPQTLDVMVTSNLFGDILTDIGSAISGSLGIAPGANINPGAHVSVDVRADSRIGARHRRQRHREPDRRHLGRRADARSPRPPRSHDRVVSAIERVVASGKCPDAGSWRDVNHERRIGRHRGGNLERVADLRIGLEFTQRTPRTRSRTPVFSATASLSTSRPHR